MQKQIKRIYSLFDIYISMFMNSKGEGGAQLAPRELFTYPFDMLKSIIADQDIIS